MYSLMNSGRMIFSSFIDKPQYLLWLHLNCNLVAARNLEDVKAVPTFNSFVTKQRLIARGS